MSTVKADKKSTYSKTLDWDVIVSDRVVVIDGEDEISVKGKRAIIHDVDKRIISIKTKQYNVFSNARFVELAERISQVFEVPIDHYATHAGGKKVLVAFDKLTKNYAIGDHTISNHPVLYNSHDGTTGIMLGSNNHIYRCKNMFNSTFKQLNIRHSSGMDEAIKELERYLNSYDDILRKELDKINKMNEVKISPAIIESCKRMLFDLKKIDVIDDLPTKTTQRLLKFDESLEIELGELGQTAYGLWNAVTHYTTHNVNKSQFITDNIFNTSARMNDKALSFCMKLR